MDAAKMFSGLADQPNVAGLQIIATAPRSGTPIAVARSNLAARPRGEFIAAEGVRFVRYTGKLILTLRISGFDPGCVKTLWPD
jgi:hypothetical protein